jgi:anti-anti-sigma factor
MRLHVTDGPHAGIIEIEGRFLGVLHAGMLLQAAEDFRARGRHYLVVDLAKAELMDSTAIGTLIAILTTMRRDGGDVRLAGLQGRMRRTFGMMRLLGNVFRDYPTTEAAERSFFEAPPFLVEA